MARSVFPPEGGTSEDWPPDYMQPPADTDDLPPTQYLIMEVLAARWRLGERMWTFPDRLRPALNALQKRGLLWWRSAPTQHDVQAYLTDAGRAAAMSDTYVIPADRRYQDLLGAIWLYIPWHYVTKQLTTEQKELFADAVDGCSGRMNADEPGINLHPADRWWRDA